MEEKKISDDTILIKGGKGPKLGGVRLEEGMLRVSPPKLVLSNCAVQHLSQIWEEGSDPRLPSTISSTSTTTGRVFMPGRAGLAPGIRKVEENPGQGCINREGNKYLEPGKEVGGVGVTRMHC